MENVLAFLYDFVLLFLLFYLIYTVFVNKKKKDYSKLKKNDVIKIFIARYNLDMRKTEYKSVLRILTIINAFIISFTATLILHINNFWLKVAVCFVVIFVLIYSLFEIAGRYLKNKEEQKNV